MEGGGAKIFQENIFINVNAVLLLNHPKGLAGGKIDSVKGEGRHPHKKILSFPLLLRKWKYDTETT